MGLLINPSKPLGGRVGVNLGRGEGDMAEKFLYRHEVGASIQEMGGEGMAKGMNAQALIRRRHLKNLFHRPLDGTPG